MRPAPAVPFSEEELLDPDRAALVIWDMQLGMAGRALDVDGIKNAVDDLVTAADLAGLPVIWSRHIGLPLEFTSAVRRAQFMERQKVSSLEDVKPHMLPDNPDVAFLPGLSPQRIISFWKNSAILLHRNAVQLCPAGYPHGSHRALRGGNGTRHRIHRAACNRPWLFCSHR